MVFSSITFLFIFLPAVLIVYFLLPEAFKNGWLLIVSLIFYGFGEPFYIFLLIASICVNFLCGILLDRIAPERAGLRRLVLIVSLMLNLGALGFFKYLGWLVPTFEIALPIGISFFTFQGLTYVVDVYRRRIAHEKSIISFAMYIALFPQLIAGPIVKYTDIETEITGRKISSEDLGYGMERFILGLGKKVLLANTCGALFEEISGYYAGGYVTVLLAWMGAGAYMLQIYFDFSGYSDMAIGIGRMLGFHFPENFDHPYDADSITGFWRKWHMTLSGFFREYVYIPLGGNRCSAARNILNLFVVWSLTGLWHGAAANFLIWGIYYFVFLVLEKYVLANAAERIPRLMKRCYTLLVVLIGWVIFSSESMERFVDTIKAMLGIGVGAGSELSLFLLTQYLPVLLAAAFLSTAFSAKLLERLGRARILVSVLAAVLSVAMLINGSYNPFLYFRF